MYSLTIWCFRITVIIIVITITFNHGGSFVISLVLKHIQCWLMVCLPQVHHRVDGALSVYLCSSSILSSISLSCVQEEEYIRWLMICLLLVCHRVDGAIPICCSSSCWSTIKECSHGTIKTTFPNLDGNLCVRVKSAVFGSISDVTSWLHFHTTHQSGFSNIPNAAFYLKITSYW